MRKARTALASAAALVAGMVARRSYQRLARFEVSEASMLPVLRPGDRVITWERTPSRGAVVVFEHPSRPDFWMVKRVVGLPGEALEIGDGSISINGSVLHEPWTAESTGPTGSWTLGPTEAFVLGDARSLSAGDSRQVGPIAIDELRRVVVARYWPNPSRIA
jgi:signal peptidase I